MRVLSLFDGMSCGQIALRELGITVEKYYASEVDKYAIAQTMLNFPDTVQLGDVRNLDGRTLGHIDLLLGGSPCQSFSFAGKRVGMETNSCANCLFYRACGDDVGTCDVSENIVESSQEPCIDYIKNETED